MNSQAMDVDAAPGGSSSGGGSTLKRCSSAPMINETNAAMTTAATNPSPPSTSRDPQLFNWPGQPRIRRFSASFSPVPGSPVSNPRLTRINQLRQEEHADLNNSRELAHEKEMHHTMQISQSWEDLTIMGESPGGGDSKLAKMVPLHVSLPPHGLHYNSPSPTRLISPTRTCARTFIRRSASPVLRPSPLSAKRKLDDDKHDYHMSPRAKRVHSFTTAERGGLLTTTPSSLGSVGTPESLSSADSPGFTFRNVDSPSPSRALPAEAMIVAKNDHEMSPR